MAGSEHAAPPSSPAPMQPQLPKRSLSILPRLSSDPLSQKRRIGCIHSVVMGFCLFCLLMTILVTQEPYRYIRSNLAIQKGIHIASLQLDSHLNSDAIWEWFEVVSDQLGGETYKEVLINCGYDPYETQTVTVDGTNYTFLKPDKQDGACAQSNLDYIGGQNDPLYLVGSHQVLVTGVFTKRATTNFPIEGSVASVEERLEVNSDKAEPLNPLKDNKVIEVCSVAVSTTSTPLVGESDPHRGLSLQDQAKMYTCIHKDAFAVVGAAYTPGSTLNWGGAAIVQDDETYYAFEAGRKASFHDADSNSNTANNTFAEYWPCYVLGSDGSSVHSGVPEYKGTAQQLRTELVSCSNMWVSKGREFRTQCLGQLGTGREATPKQSYLAGLFKTESVPHMYEMLFGCQSLINWNASDIDNAFVGVRRPIDTYLEYDKSYGTFFPAGSEKNWVEEALLGQQALKMHGFLDKQTTEATMYFIIRNLDADALFYTLVRVTIEFRVNGYTNVKYRPIFSPIIQYEYGFDGYGWRNRQMYVWEILFLIVFSLFVLREIYQLVFSRVIPCIERVRGRVPVSPVEVNGEVEKEGQEKRQAVSSTRHSEEKRNGSEDDCRSTDEDGQQVTEVHDVERGHSNDSSGCRSQAAEKSPRRPNTAGMLDLNKDGIDDLKQLGSFMRDLNNNGVDDAEELMELVDDLLPDAAGMLDILDWLTIGIVSLSIYFRVDYIHKTSDLHEFFLELAKEMNYQDSMTEFINRFTEIDENITIMNVLVMILVFFGMVQFFRYLSFDKRLGIVTATIKESLGSLLPVLIIFLVVMFAYSVLGTVMYGAHLKAWSNLAQSTSQLFLLILGEFGSYFDIMQINPGLSAVFFWTYITMALFLLFNMVLAVIFTVYEEKNNEINTLEAARKEKEQENKKTK